MTDIQQMLDLADSFDHAVGLYRKMPDGRMVEIHMKKIAMIQAALRAAASRVVPLTPGYGGPLR